jgi:hypothetical protein
MEFDFDGAIEVPVVPSGVFFDQRDRNPEQYHAHCCLNCDRIIDLIPAGRARCGCPTVDHDYSV